MQQAFGPYTDDTLYEPDYNPRPHKLAVVAWVVILTVLSSFVVVVGFQ